MALTDGAAAPPSATELLAQEILRRLRQELPLGDLVGELLVLSRGFVERLDQEAKGPSWPGRG